VAIRSAGAALCAALLLATLSDDARAQGVVLAPDGKPLRVSRARALLVFQERALLEHHANEPNRQDLLVELELSEPAPAGCVWVLACPPAEGEAFAGSNAVVSELSGYWRGSVKLPEKDPWPEKKNGTALRFGAALDATGLLTALKERGIAPASSVRDMISADRVKKWRFFVASISRGERRPGAAHLKFQPLAAVYPAAIGARQQTGERWWLPPTELMVLHTHFINVNDNPWGLERGVGLHKQYQDLGTLEEGRPLWHVPRIRRLGQKREPGTMTVKNLPAVAGFVGRLGAARSLYLTVVEGRPSRSDRAGLDFPIYSHYPSAVEPTESWTAWITLGICLVGVVLLATVLLRRKGFVE